LQAENQDLRDRLGFLDDEGGELEIQRLSKENKML
jgi:hypothetical protein